MKRNRIAAVLVIILGSLSFWFIVNNKKGTIKETLRDFSVADTAAVDKIFLADKSGNSSTLIRNTAGKGWTVNGKYQVRMDAMHTLLETIKRVDVKEPVGKKSMDNVIKQLAADAIRCEVYSGKKLIKAYYIGSYNQDLTGTYMILIDPETMQPSAKPFLTYIPGFDGYLTTRYITDEKLWRDRTAMTYIPSDIQSVKLEVPDKPELGYELKVKGNNDYEITTLSAKPEKVQGVDPLAVKQYLSYFQQVDFETLDIAMSKKEVDSTLKSTPLNILTVTDSKGKTNSIKFFARKPKKENRADAEGHEVKFDIDRMNALLVNTNDFAIVQYYVFGKMMPPVDYFRKKNEQSKPKEKS